MTGSFSMTCVTEGIEPTVESVEEVETVETGAVVNVVVVEVVSVVLTEAIDDLIC